MDSDIAYFVTYPCPRCKVELEAEHGGWQGWLRCPACGTPALPPEILFGHPLTKRRVKAVDGDADLDAMEDGDEPGIAGRPGRSTAVDEAASPLARALRLVFFTGLVISLFLLLIAFLDQNQRATAIFGTLAIVCFLLLLRTSGRRPRDL